MADQFATTITQRRPFTEEAQGLTENVLRAYQVLTGLDEQKRRQQSEKANLLLQLGGQFGLTPDMFKELGNILKPLGVNLPSTPSSSFGIPTQEAGQQPAISRQPQTEEERILGQPPTFKDTFNEVMHNSGIDPTKIIPTQKQITDLHKEAVLLHKEKIAEYNRTKLELFKEKAAGERQERGITAAEERQDKAITASEERQQKMITAQDERLQKTLTNQLKIVDEKLRVQDAEKEKKEDAVEKRQTLKSYRDASNKLYQTYINLGFGDKLTIGKDTYIQLRDALENSYQQTFRDLGIPFKTSNQIEAEQSNGAVNPVVTPVSTKPTPRF